MSHDAESAEGQRLIELNADYADYQSWTDRVIPVIVCERVA